MFCPYCGNAVEDGNKFCPICGKGLSAEVGENPYLVQESGRQAVTSRLNEKLRSPIFLAVCILFTVAAVTSLLAGLPESVSLPVFEVLFAIFCWVLYLKARSDEVSSVHVRNVSGTVFAYTIVLYVFGGILTLASLAMPSVMETFLKDPQFLAALREAAGIDASTEALFQEYLEILPTVMSVVFFVVGVVLILVTVFGIRRIHGYAKSLYHNVDNPTLPVLHSKGACGWLITCGILVAINGLTQQLVLSMVSGICVGVAYILLGILIPKLTPEE